MNATQLADQARSFLREAGYTAANMRPNYTFTYRADDGALANDKADLVAFGNRPHDMRSACASVVALRNDSDLRDKLLKLRYLSAPVAIVGMSSGVSLYTIRRDVPATPTPVETAGHDDWPAKFRSRLDQLAPATILAAKLGQGRQLDFFDADLAWWVEDITRTALTTLLERLLTDTIAHLPKDDAKHGSAQEAVIRLVFHLFACRVLEDKGVLAVGSSPAESLATASQMFPENIAPGVVRPRCLTKQLVQSVFDSLKQRFAFASLTTEMLGHAYENALVTPSLRRERGIYYTPRAVTDYILSRLPIEGIAQDKRCLVDPCCGSGSFLLAGFERLSGLLPETWSPHERHQYLRSRILGFDVDEFAREIASLSLVLADLYNRNGWKVRQCDVQQLTADTIGKRPTIVVTNPPFREIKTKGTRREFAADVLARLVDLSANGALLGIVLPQSVLDSRAGRTARAAVLDTCEILEIAMLPGAVFQSNAETAVLFLRKNESRGTSITLGGTTTIRELRPRDMQAFRQGRVFTTTYSVETAQWQKDTETRFVLSPVGDIWRKLASTCSKLRDVALVKNGLQVKADDQSSVKDRKCRATDVKYVDRLDVLRPFALLSEHELKPYRWLHYGTQLRRQGDVAVFRGEKVLVNSNRNPGSPWRLVAAIAPAGLYFSDNFHGAIPIPGQNASLEQLAAVLNSPVANAWFAAHSHKRKVVINTLYDVPFPRFQEDAANGIRRLVRAMEKAVVAKWRRAEEGMFYDGLDENADTARLLAEIDTAVYDAYGLTLQERQQIEKLMRGERRPG